MAATIIKWIVVLLAVMNFGYMAFDGGRALVKGDYIRPSSGTYAGQLGPWSKLVEKIGINPESTTMKVIFLAWGLIGLMITVCFILKMSWAPNALIVINILSLWYLIPGTVSSTLQIILLVIRKFIV
ncbi:MAG TPA: hypothetical protein VFI06_17695 [Chitinophagaceae bacterium]|nr:hypothetical protein [Chitinophagaceae bacterium]